MRMRSARRNRLRRLATTNVVRPAMAWRSAETISCSVRGSTEAVGSSRMSAGEGEALSLAAGEVHARFAEDGIVAVGHGDDEFVCGRGAGGAFDLFTRGVRAAEGDVRGHRVRKEKAFLVNDADLAAELVEIEIAHVRAVHEHA